MDNSLEPAIAALERRLQDTERKANALRDAINTLCEEAGIPPRYPDGGGGGRQPNGSSGRPLTQIKSDTFFGQKQTTAIRSYLEMRRAQGLGPATPKEIFETLKQGGYQFGAQKDETAMVSLRALLRKNNATFLRVPNTGTYGLRSWYPHAKISKAQTGEADQNQTQPEGGDLDSDVTEMETAEADDASAAA